MQYKTTKRLFKGTYQYKIVLVCSGAQWFRSGDMDATLTSLKSLVVNDKRSGYTYGIKTQEDLDYAFLLQKNLKKLKDIEIRVESPWITVYSNNKSDVDLLAKLSPNNVKYICIPECTLEKDTVVMPKMDYEFRITMGKTTREHSAFIEWSENNSKVKLTKSCKRDLIKDRSWGGTHFYITGEKNLMLARMHLGGSINKIERIIKQIKA
jgi:hypothetical protein